MIMMDLDPKNVNNLFFTHHHFDHDIDYPCFLLCRWDQSIGKENTLNVFGPKLTEKLTEETGTKICWFVSLGTGNSCRSGKRYW